MRAPPPIKKEYDLSIVIPSRNEEWLARTIQDILEHREGKTEVIAVLDGSWGINPIPMHPDVTVIYHPISVGQRAGTNDAVKLSKAKYVLKLDAHCSMDQGFDRKMLEAFEEVGDDVTMAPTLRNLWAFDWVCKKCGNRWYQGPTPEFCCSDKKGKVKNELCDSKDFERDIKWIAKERPQNTSFCFDTTLHFQYNSKYMKKQEGDLVETMSLQGSCFMLTRERYWDLNICDEAHGSWGQQGTEVACASWLSGGRVLVNRRTYYGHLFRTQGGDFSFPYPNPGNKVEKARKYSRDLWFNNKHKKQILPLSWLVEKFNPPYWNEPEGAKVLEMVNKAGEEFKKVNTP